MKISVIICTHNPREDYLTRVLDALKNQSLAKEQWELLLIDNASKEPLSSQWDLSWHPNGRHIREDELGLTPARLRGIREATASLIVYVDDDNILKKDYLEVAQKIHRQYPQLAAFGGSISPEYEVEPPQWFHQYRQMIAIREVDFDRWSNNPTDFSTTPIGAGMVITKQLGEYYAKQTHNNPLKKSLDRKGKELTGGGDIDIALTSCDMGYGKGVFSSLKLTHIIPPTRTTLVYLLRLQEAAAYSLTIRNHVRKKPKSYIVHKKIINIAKSFLFRLVKSILMTRVQRKMERARVRGIKRARAFLLAIDA
jgi:glycosyltransferase involved in cell wall biosynthesis